MVKYNLRVKDVSSIIIIINVRVDIHRKYKNEIRFRVDSEFENEWILNER